MTADEKDIQPLDVVVAVSAGAIGVAAGAARLAGSVLRPAARTAVRARWLPAQLRPETWLVSMSQVGEARREALRAQLSDLVLELVDLNRVVSGVDLDAVAAQLDIDAVIHRVDLVDLAAEVIDGVDLPGIIRESTGSMASETIRGVRMQGIVADEAVDRLVDRLLLRRARAVQPPPAPVAGSAGPGPVRPVGPAVAEP